MTKLQTATGVQSLFAFAARFDLVPAYLCIDTCRLAVSAAQLTTCELLEDGPIPYCCVRTTDAVKEIVTKPVFKTFRVFPC